MSSNYIYRYTDSKKRTIAKIIRHDPSYSYLALEPHLHTRYELHDIWCRIKRKEEKLKKKETKDGE